MSISYRNRGCFQATAIRWISAILTPERLGWKREKKLKDMLIWNIAIVGCQSCANLTDYRFHCLLTDETKAREQIAFKTTLVKEPRQVCQQQSQESPLQFVFSYCQNKWQFYFERENPRWFFLTSLWSLIRPRQSSYRKELFTKASGLGFVHCKSDLESKSDVGRGFFQSTVFSWVQEHPIPFGSSKFHAQDQGVLFASLSWPTTNKKTNPSSQIIKTARDSSKCLYF